jgi:uncharacterized protein
VPWSCWMGMIPRTFIVIENTPAPKVAKTEPEAEKPQADVSDQEKVVKEIERIWNDWLEFYRRLLSESVL